jgi:hypothetical protein
VAEIRARAFSPSERITFSPSENSSRAQCSRLKAAKNRRRAKVVTRSESSASRARGLGYRGTSPSRFTVAHIRIMPSNCRQIRGRCLPLLGLFHRFDDGSLGFRPASPQRMHARSWLLRSAPMSHPPAPKRTARPTRRKAAAPPAVEQKALDQEVSVRSPGSAPVAHLVTISWDVVERPFGRISNVRRLGSTTHTRLHPLRSPVRGLERLHGAECLAERLAAHPRTFAVSA